MRASSSGLRHSSSVRRANAASSSATSAALFVARSFSEPKRSSATRSARPSSVQRSTQYLSGCRQQIISHRPSAHLIVRGERVGQRRARLAEGRALPVRALHGRQHVRTDHPQRRADERHVDDRALARSFTPEQRARDAERQLRAAIAIADRTALRDRLGKTLRGDGLLDRATRPERCRVVRRRVGVRAAHAVAVPTRVDQARVDCAQRVDAEPEPVEHRRQEVGEEHVGVLDELEERGAAFVGLEIDGHALLVAVGHLHRIVDRRRVGPRQHETAVTVAALRVLDLDHLRTPVRE